MKSGIENRRGGGQRERTGGRRAGCWKKVGVKSQEKERMKGIRKNQDIEREREG